LRELGLLGFPGTQQIKQRQQNEETIGLCLKVGTEWLPSRLSSQSHVNTSAITLYVPTDLYHT